MKDIVIDLETFGVGADSAVVSIGAVSLTGSEFYAVIEKPSGAVDVGSVRWWLEQRPEVREAVKSGQGEGLVLGMFANWLDTLREAHAGETFRIWGSEDFDTVILGRAYERNDLDRPWHYQEPRGLRTVLDLAGVDEDSMPWEGIEHIAIDCARHAATALTLALARLKPVGVVAEPTEEAGEMARIEHYEEHGNG